jgi:hypothetical protein
VALTLGFCFSGVMTLTKGIRRARRVDPQKWRVGEARRLCQNGAEHVYGKTMVPFIPMRSRPSAKHTSFWQARCQSSTRGQPEVSSTSKRRGSCLVVFSRAGAFLANEQLFRKTRHIGPTAGGARGDSSGPQLDQCYSPRSVGP